MKWADGLRAQPDVLEARATTLSQVHDALEQTRSQHASLDFGPWEGKGREAHNTAYRHLSTEFSGCVRRLPSIASALRDSAQTFRDIQAAQQSTIELAARWDFEIDDDGKLHNRASGLSSLDPRRAGVWFQAGASIFLLETRLTIADGYLAARLFGSDLIDDVKSGLDKLGDTLRDGMDWAKSAISDAVDHIQQGAGAAWDALKRLGSTITNPPKWLTELIHEPHKLPQLAEVLGTGLYLGGQAVGALANLVAGKDLHLFDDGRPYHGDIVRTTPHAVTGPETVYGDMMKVYDERGDTATDPDKRPAVYVTAVGEGADRRYLVSIPGTTEEIGQLPGWNGGPQGTDWPANLKGVGYGTSAVTESTMYAIDRAIAQDQAAHPGATGKPQIVLTGHSQGGIIAGNIAADSTFTSRYQVNGVVTAGSPVETLGVPPEIPVYNYQHPKDIVPQTDLNPGPSGQNLTQIDLRDRGWNPMESHGQQNYLEDIMALPSRPSDEVLEPYFGKEGDQYTVEIGRETD